MSNIGSFKKVGDSDEYHGEIFTLGLDVKNVRIVPEPNRSSEKAPTHRIFVGRAEIGAAWRRQSTKAGNDYLSVKLEAPTVPTIFANLVVGAEGAFNLIWAPTTRSDYQRGATAADQSMPGPDGGQARARARGRAQPKSDPNSEPKPT